MSARISEVPKLKNNRKLTESHQTFRLWYFNEYSIKLEIYDWDGIPDFYDPVNKKWIEFKNYPAENVNGWRILPPSWFSKHQQERFPKMLGDGQRILLAFPYKFHRGYWFTNLLKYIKPQEGGGC